MPKSAEMAGMSYRMLKSCACIGNGLRVRLFQAVPLARGGTAWL